MKVNIILLVFLGFLNETQQTLFSVQFQNRKNKNQINKALLLGQKTLKKKQDEDNENMTHDDQQENQSEIEDSQELQNEESSKNHQENFEDNAELSNQEQNNESQEQINEFQEQTTESQEQTNESEIQNHGEEEISNNTDNQEQHEIIQEHVKTEEHTQKQEIGQIEQKKQQIAQEVTDNIKAKINVAQVEKTQEKSAQKIQIKQDKPILAPKMPDLTGFETVNIVEKLSPYTKSLYEEYHGDLPSQELAQSLASKKSYNQDPVLIMDVMTDKVTKTITPFLPSETKSGLWKTSTVPIKKMREVFYETEGMVYDTIDRNGENFYVENPIQSARANIILKKGTKGVMKDFINIQNPISSSHNEELNRDDRRLIESLV